MKLRLVVVLYVLMMPRVLKIDNIASCTLVTLPPRPPKLAEFASEIFDWQNDPSDWTFRITVKHVKIALSHLHLTFPTDSTWLHHANSHATCRWLVWKHLIHQVDTFCQSQCKLYSSNRWKQKCELGAETSSASRSHYPSDAPRVKSR